MPASANSKKPNSRPPAETAASLTTMFTGVPVRVSSEPALAANASGISSFDGAIPARTATTTTTGSKAATAPLMEMKAVNRRQSADDDGEAGPARACAVTT
jgi:hypothetical protein